MLRRLPFIVAAIVAFLAAALMSDGSRPAESDSELEETNALDAFEFWYTQRAAPFDKIPIGAFMRAADHSRQMPHERDVDRTLTDSSQWTSLGPDNVGGRVLAIAVNPLDPNIVWVGAASGGLWKSTTGGAGATAWSYVSTGQPTVAVSSIAIHPTNPGIMYIGTGEVGSAYGFGLVGTPGARSTYGMGVLKSTDGGASWNLTSLAFTFPQVTAVQKVLLNPRNPNTLYAITTEGTFKSVNAGLSWTLVHNVLMGMDLVINPADTSILYAAYGQRNSTPGKGVWKTTNAGGSWTRLTSLDTTNFGRTSLAIVPASPQTVYAGVADGSSSTLRGLYKTVNGGTTWTLVNSTNYVNAQGWYDNVIAAHPADSNVVLCAGLDIYKSTDGGTNLAQKSFWYLGYGGVVPAGGPEGPPNYAHADHHAMAFNPSNPNIVYFGCDGGIFVSTDGGETFAGHNGGFVTIQVYNGLADAETTPNVALVGLQDNGTLKYQGTLSWNKTFGGDGGWCAIDPTNENVMFEEYVYLAMSRSSDGGASWFSCTNGLATGSANANFIAPFVISPSNPNTLYAGAKVVYKTTDGGDTWSPTNGDVNFNGTNVSCIGVSYRNKDTLLAATGSGGAGASFQVFRSTNGGTTWVNVTGGLPGRFPTDISFDPTTSLIAYITYSGYGAPHVFRSINAGLTWADVTSNLPDIPCQSIVVDPFYPSDVYVGTDLGVYRSTNSGASWFVFDTGMPPAMVLDLGISNANRSIRAATFGNGVYERGLRPLNAFDYRTLAFVSPSNSSVLPANTPISPITASFRNNGAVVSPDSFNVEYVILDGTSGVYSNTQRVPALAAGETRNVTFSGSYTPTATGTLTLRAITIAGDQIASNDTLTGSVNVVAPGTIAAFHVIKTPAPYTEITGGSPGPSGDDAQTAIQLPFAFTFDGFTYDSLQISTNGWAEFGTGPRGSLRGLSDDSQVGLGNENGRLYSTARPTKTLGPWFEDLNTVGGGEISYQTLAGPGGDVLVVQWKNMLAYFDPSTTTTRINFQVRLHASTNMIEFDYGPVVPGTLSGSDLGAMTGMKDELGGNYHFYDIALGGSGTSGQAITNLSPLTNWPGNDSSYIFGPNIVAPTDSIFQGWNIVSVPVTRSDNHVHSVFPTAIPGTTFRYSGSYLPDTVLAPGRGYWTKFPTATNQSLPGTTMPSVAASVVSGWNLVGSVDHVVPAPSGGIITSVFYEYGSTGYHPASELKPGLGFWVKTSSAGTINIGPTALPAEHAPDVADMNRLNIRDSRGQSQTLYFDEQSNKAPDPSLFDMPPLPPMGSFDVRFASNRMLELYPAGAGHGGEFVMEVEGGHLPIVLSATIGESRGKRFFVDVSGSGKPVVAHELIPGTTTDVRVLEQSRLVLRVTDGTSVPAEFALNQNYPNPFNPTTTIRYALPGLSNVQLVVYDLLGKEVRRLVDDERAAGYYSATWDGTNGSGSRVSSGMYFFRLSTGAFTAVRKMLLVR